MRLITFFALSGVLFYLMRAVSVPKLKNFKRSEFGLWWPLMDADLLKKLDAFREEWGYPVEVSKAEGAIGRHVGNSQHNIDLWGRVKAVDTFPRVPDGLGGYRYMQTAEERRRAYEVAKKVGFTGIGIYTDTAPGNLLHVDTREGERVATWSRVSGDYRGLAEVLA